MFKTCIRQLSSGASTRHVSVKGIRVPGKVKIVEVGPRDGLQNEKMMVPTEVKIGLINRLVGANIQAIEATSFVSPKWVPQMSDAAQVMKGLPHHTQARFSVLTPNMKGFEAALKAGAKEVAVFAAASESFAQKNTAASIKENLERHEEITKAARAHNIPVRGYVSCVLGCPYEGKVSPEKVRDVVKMLFDIGCYEVSLGDTIGIGNPVTTSQMLDSVLTICKPEQLAGHFHNTYGTALANIVVSLQYGISVIDSSVAGLGGCPYARGATGNVATEDVVCMLHGMGIETGVDINLLLNASHYICSQLNIVSRSNAGNALTRLAEKNAEKNAEQNVEKKAE